MRYNITTGKLNKLPRLYQRLNDHVDMTFVFKDRFDVVDNQTDLDFKIARKGNTTALIEKDESDGIVVSGNEADLSFDTDPLEETGVYLCQLFTTSAGKTYVIIEFELKLETVIGD